MKTLKGTKTEKNLLTAFAGESQARNRYTYFSSQATKEDYQQIAAVFLETADNEKERGEDRVFKRERVVKWKCRNCGYIHEGTEAPEECPACGHARAYFELLSENY